MDESNQDEPLLDGVDDVPESAFDSAPVRAAFQDEVYAETVRVLRGKRRRRKLKWAAALGAAYAAGILTIIAIPDAPMPPTAPEVERTPVVPAAVEQPNTGTESMPYYEALALALHRAEPDERATILRAAGDHYFEGYNDLAEASLYYRQYLAALSPEERLQPSSGDNWLLLTMRQAWEKDD